VHLRTRIALAILLFASAGSVHAQEPGTPRDLDRASVLFVSAATFDWTSTWVANSSGVHEQNPILSWSEQQPARMIAIGAAIDMAGLFAVRAAAKKWHHEKAATVALYGAAVFRGWLGYANFVAANVTANNPAEAMRRRTAR